MSTPVILYRTKTPTDLVPASIPRRRFPLPGSSGSTQFAAYAFDADFSQQIDQFPPAPKNTPSNTSPFALNDANAILTGYSQPNYIGAGLAKFTAQFQKVPATWNDIKVQPFPFPGFPGYLGQTGTRDPFTDKVDVRFQYDYYVLDPANLLGGAPTAGGGVANASSMVDSGGVAVKTVYGMADIPLIAKSIFCIAFGGMPDYTNRTVSLTPSGGVTFGSATWYQTLPTKAHYQAWMTAAATYAWQSLVWDGTTDGAGAGNGFGQIVLDDSQLAPMVGNIIARVTMFVLCK